MCHRLRCADLYSALKTSRHVAHVRIAALHAITVARSCDHRLHARVYRPSISYHPLTYMLASYLSSVEKRLASVENLVSQLLPGIDLEAVLSSPDLANASLPVAASPPPEAVQAGPSALTPGRSQNALRESVIPEAVPDDANGFDWQEENVSVDGLTDGMAALSVEPAGVGYLGIFIEAIRGFSLTTTQAQRLGLYSCAVCLTGQAFCISLNLNSIFSQRPRPPSVVSLRLHKSHMRL